MNGTRLRGLFRQILALPPGLTERQQRLVRAVCESALADQETTIALFRQRLRLLDPELSVRLERVVNEQGGRLVAIMNFVVDHSHCPGKLAPESRELGRLLDGYGIADRGYAVVEAALIWTFEQAPGGDFTAETREAWTTFYGLLADEMKAAANERKMPILPPC